eukprot:4201227-Amphidinium_carterae.1
MDLIEGLENTQDASAFGDVIHRYKANLREFFPRMQEWENWLLQHVEEACGHTNFVVQWIGLYVREIWIQLDQEDLVASNHYRPLTDMVLPTVSPSVNNSRTPGLHIHFNSVQEVTAETVMLVPLYLLGVFTAWAEQMRWDDMPSR